jgi:hypothetical protein
MGPRAKAKTVAQQALLLRQLAVTRRSDARAGRLVWEGQIQPTSHSEAYVVRIDYKPPKRPEISVVSPPLEPPRGVRLPHVYPGDRLCLCYPGQWGPEMRIDTTLVPWVAEWLFYYELWLFTGIWHGGGHGSPQSDKQPEPLEGVGRQGPSRHAA